MRALIFDFDGLMVDSEWRAVEAVIAYLAGHGVTVDATTIGHLFGGTGPEIDALWEELLRSTLGGEPDLGALDALVLAAGTDTELLPGVRPLIDGAHDAGWRVGLATGRRRQRLDPELARHGLADRFHAIVTAEEVGRGKPAPDVFLAAAERLGVEAAGCVVLEDSVHGAEGALAAGMRVVVCPSAATASCTFPVGAVRVGTLEDLTVEDLATSQRWPTP